MLKSLFAPIRKRFRDSESVQKCPPHHFPNPQGYEIQRINFDKFLTIRK